MLEPKGIRQVSSPVTDMMLRELEPGDTLINLANPLTDPEYRRLAGLLESRPDVTLRAYEGIGHFGLFQDLRFLQHFPRLKRFRIDSWHLTELTSLRLLRPDLVALGIGRTKTKSLSLSILRSFPELRELSVTGLTKDIETIGQLHTLEALSLWSIGVPDLKFLSGLQLKRFNLILGGIRDLDGMQNAGPIEALEISLVRRLANIRPVGALTELRELTLQSLQHVTALPSCRRLVNLRRVYLENMGGLRDMTPFLGAQALEELLVVNARRMEPEDFAPLRQHKTLSRLMVGFGSGRKNARLPSVMGWQNKVHGEGAASDLRREGSS